jgi:hypothetical protein
LSLEVGEHLPSEFEDTFINNLHNNNKYGMVLSWAIEGQGGHGHFNERNNDYIKSKICELGYLNDIYSENILRKNSTCCYFKNTIMVFRKFPIIDKYPLIDINIFLLCYNESALIPHMVKHYKKYLPSCKITIYDNESTDNSVEIAKELGCSIVSWNSNNQIDDFKYKEIKNNCWKTIENGWIIMADMDEFLCVTEEELFKEKIAGTSILNTLGYDMVGESKTIDLTDIDLQEIKKYCINEFISKKCCFLREKISEINYGNGAHSCSPQGEIIYSSTTYLNKHMKFLGLDYLIKIFTSRYERAEEMRKHGLAMHYQKDTLIIEEMYNNFIKNSKLLENDSKPSANDL